MPERAALGAVSIYQFLEKEPWPRLSEKQAISPLPSPESCWSYLVGSSVKSALGKVEKKKVWGRRGQTVDLLSPSDKHFLESLIF